MARMANTNRLTSGMGAGCLVLFALPFAAVGVGMGVWLASTFGTYLSARNWIETPARIVRADLKVQHGQKSTTYQVTAEYVYEYGGRKYRGYRVGLSGGSDNVGSFQQDAYGELSTYRQSGKPFRCYVNPGRPENAILYRDLRWEMIALQLIFVLAFGGAGFGLLISGLLAYRTQRAETALAATHAEAPWMWKADWAAGQIVSSSRNTMLAALAVALFWNVVSSPLWLVLPHEILDRSNRLALIGLVFPAIGLILVYWAVFCFLRWRKYGQSVFQMASVPGVIGGQLAGVIRTSAKVRPEDGFHLLLRCVRRMTTGSGKQRSTSERIVWEDERVVMHELLDDQSEQSAIPVVFQIPYDCRPSDEQTPNDQTLWRLTASAEVPGIDYAATFLVPVFKTAQSDPNFVPGKSAMPEYVGAPPPERELREAGVRKTASPDGEGVRFVFPMFRAPGMAIILAVLCLVFSGAIVVMLKAGELLVFPIVFAFGLVDLLFLVILANVCFYRSVVDISARNLSIRGGLFGLGSTRRIEAARVKTMETRQVAWSNQSVYYSVVVVCGDGKPITAGTWLPGARLATAVARQMEQALGMNPEPPSGPVPP